MMTLDEFRAKLAALLDEAQQGGLRGADRFEVAAILEEAGVEFIGEDE